MIIRTRIPLAALLLLVVAFSAAAEEKESAPDSCPDVQVASAHDDRADGIALFQPAQAIPFTLPDQFKDMHTLAFPQDKPVVLGIADRHGAEQVLKWYHPLHKAYDDQVRYIALGAMHTLPGILAPIIRHFLRKDVDKPICLDWEGDVVNGYHYEENISNLFVIDRDGKILLRIDGPRTDEGLAQVKTVLDDLLKTESINQP